MACKTEPRGHALVVDGSSGVATADASRTWTERVSGQLGTKVTAFEKMSDAGQSMGVLNYPTTFSDGVAKDVAVALITAMRAEGAPATVVISADFGGDGSPPKNILIVAIVRGSGPSLGWSSMTPRDLAKALPQPSHLAEGFTETAVMIVGRSMLRSWHQLARGDVDLWQPTRAPNMIEAAKVCNDAADLALYPTETIPPESDTLMALGIPTTSSHSIRWRSYAVIDGGGKSFFTCVADANAAPVITWEHD